MEKINYPAIPGIKHTLTMETAFSVCLTHSKLYSGYFWIYDMI